LSNSDKIVFLCPLDWGLGHASRIIPLVYRFKSDGYKVLLGGSGKSGHLLQNTFRDVPFITFPSYTMKYYFRGSWFFFNIFIQLPALLYSSIREHFLLKKFAKKQGVDIVVSDNRYGLYCSTTRNIIITHQISPVLPGLLRWAEYPLYRILTSAINRFDECWIPDYAGEVNLSGKLSHRYPAPHNARFIGTLSRFSVIPGKTGNELYDVVIVLSAPQPELRRMTYKMIEQAKETNLKILIICGFEEDMQKHEAGRPGLKIVSHLEPAEFRSSMEKAAIIICMAGYSGIMDLVEIGKTAILIPTTGQSEQEYLSQYLDSHRHFLCVSGSQINLKNIKVYADKMQNCRPFHTFKPQEEKDFPTIG